jgi:hypothetical protein
MCHPVQRRTSHQQLRRLSIERARTDSLAKDHLHAKDLRLGQRSAMIVDVPLPLSTPFAGDLIRPVEGFDFSPQKARIYGLFVLCDFA